MRPTAFEAPVLSPRARRRIAWSAHWPVFGSHVERLGLVRTLVGGGSMYLSIPVFAVLHAAVLPILERVVAPLLGLELTPGRRFLVIDRHRIRGLPLLDRLNCAFCDWANGLALRLHARLDAIDAWEGELAAGRRALLGVAILPLAPLIAGVQLLGVRLVFDVLVSRPLGMRRTSSREALAGLRAGFGDRRRGLARLALRHEKVFAVRLTAALAQIESAWCPLRNLCPRAHCERPAHHERFLAPDGIEAMRRILRARGTVLEDPAAETPARDRG